MPLFMKGKQPEDERISKFGCGNDSTWVQNKEGIK